MSPSASLWQDGTFKISILSAAIRYYMHLYYLGTPEITDATFDLLYKELQMLEKRKGYTRPDSPTQSPGGLIPDAQGRQGKAKG